jgi:hypothetical protein
MDAFVLFNVLGHFFGNHIMVAEQAAEKRSEFVTVLVVVGRSFHRPVSWKSMDAIWGIEKCCNLVNSSFLLYRIVLVLFSIATDVDNFLFCAY